MTIYEGNSQQFRNRPSKSALGVVSASVLLIALVLTPLFASALEACFAYFTGWPGPLIVHAAPASPHQEIYSYWTETSWLRIGPALAASGCAILGILLIYLWPTDQKLSSKLFVHGLATILVLYGFVARCLEAETVGALSDTTGMSQMLWKVLFAATGAWLLMRFERNVLELLRNLYEVDTPASRFPLWSVRILPGLMLIGLFCALNQYLPGVYATVIGIGATLLETISHQPKRSFERIGNPRMQEAAATLPIVALVLMAGSIYIFGTEAHPSFRARALVVSSSLAVSIEPLSLVRSRYSWHPPKSEPRTPEEKKIDIRWSKPKA